MWVAEPDGVLSYISPMVDEPVNRDVGQRLEAWYARMNPDDRERVRAEWAAWLTTGEPFETRFRVEWPSGTWRWVRSRARPQYQAGEIVKWFGAFTDITREVELEVEVQHLKQMLALQRTSEGHT